MTYQEAVDTLINGNKEDFKKWLKKCSKLNMLQAIEYAASFQPRHMLINYMLLYLKGK